MNKVKCNDCVYWMRYKLKPKNGECRKNTPFLSPRGDGTWPTTKGHDFCFSGEPKEEEEPEQPKIRPKLKKGQQPYDFNLFDFEGRN